MLMARYILNACLIHHDREDTISMPGSILDHFLKFWTKSRILISIERLAVITFNTLQNFEGIHEHSHQDILQMLAHRMLLS
jgi:hypothetical protein